jgi:hypothetical protein
MGRLMLHGASSMPGRSLENRTDSQALTENGLFQRCGDEEKGVIRSLQCGARCYRLPEPWEDHHLWGHILGKWRTISKCWSESLMPCASTPSYVLTGQMSAPTHNRKNAYLNRGYRNLDFSSSTGPSLQASSLSEGDLSFLTSAGEESAAPSRQ